MCAQYHMFLKSIVDFNALLMYYYLIYNLQSVNFKFDYVFFEQIIILTNDYNLGLIR